MITDSALTLTTPTITTADTYNSLDSIDLVSLRDMGEGHTIMALLTVTTAFAGGTSVDFQLWTADATSTSATGSLTGGNFLMSVSGGAIADANLTAGAQRYVALPSRVVSNVQHGSRYQRHLVLRAVTLGTHSAGVASVTLLLDNQDGRTSYPSGFTVA
jgi:hypothetical protein